MFLDKRMKVANLYNPHQYLHNGIHAKPKKNTFTSINEHFVLFDNIGNLEGRE